LYSSTINHCYYQNRISVGVGSGTDTAAVVTKAQLAQQETFAGFDFDAVWTMQGHAGYPYPQLQGMAHVQQGESSVDFTGGKGILHDPYQISTAQELSRMRDHLHAYFILNNDIVFTSADFAQGGAFYNDGAGFIPIGTSAEPFTGMLNGDGHVVKGLYQNISVSQMAYGGLFGYVRDGGIENLGLEESHIDVNIGSGNSYAGGIAGYVSGASMIYNCYNTGGVSGSTTGNYSYVGGIAGYLTGSAISGCYNTGSISGSSGGISYTGGIAGRMSGGTINGCYNTGGVSSTGSSNIFAGGIAGYVTTGNTISLCHNTGSVSGASSGDDGIGYTGGIAGYMAGSVIENCYNTGSANGSGFSCRAGGIAGYLTSSTISGCYSTGGVTGDAGAGTCYTGGIAGYAADSSAIDGSYNAGSVTGSGSGIAGTSYAGGIAGHLTSSTISLCYNTDNVNSSGFSSSTGGIAGYLTSSTISNCYNTGGVTGDTGSTSYAGGVAGYTTSSSTISRCYNTGRVAESHYAGGITGSVTVMSTISDCYNTGRMSASYYTGGIAGLVYSGTLRRCYNTGGMSNNNSRYTGGIAGHVAGSNTFSRNYYLDRISAGVGFGADTAVAVTKVQLAQQETFVGFDFGAVWTMQGHADYPYPELREAAHVQQDGSSADFAGGKGTPYDPYQISTAGQLNRVRNHLHAYFVLNNDIVFTSADFAQGGTFYNSGRGFTPIGTAAAPFSGVLDGNGYVIRGLYQYRSVSQTAYGGLFGYVQDGSIENLGLEKGNININTGSGSSYVGGIAGYVSGISTIYNCYNTGSVKSNGNGSYAGGIVGYVADSVMIRDCYNTGSVTGEDYAGGIAGRVSWSAGTIISCYNTGSVSGLYYIFSYTGGITGCLENGTVNNCYNTGSVAGSYYAGGIVGYITGGSTISQCYNTGGVNGSGFASGAGGIAGYMAGSNTVSYCYYLNRISAGVGSGTDTAVAVTRAQLAQQQTFAGFDFGTVWTMQGNPTYAFAQLQAVPLVKTYATSIAVTSESDTVVKTKTLQMTADVLPETADDKRVTWSVISGTGAVTIDQNGLLTATRTGTVTIKATARDGSGIVGYDGVTGSKEITVTPLLADSITITSAGDTVIENGTLQMTAVVLPADADDKSYAWSVENGTGEASINNDGLLTGTKRGTVIVKATTNDGSGTTGSKEITVIPLPVSSITVSSASNTVVQGLMMQMKATVLPADADDKSHTWNVKNGTGQAQINQSGLLKGIKAGTVTVTATANDGSGTAGSKVITVVPPAPASITAASAGYNSIKISWSKVSGATGYELYRATSSSGTYSRVATVTGGSTLSYINTGRTAGTTYYYKVRAYVTSGSTNVPSSFSSVKSAKPVPATPAITTASAGYNSVKISWGKVSGATGYQIYRATSKEGTYSRIATITSGSTVTYTNKSLTTGRTYYYKVRAYRTVNGTNVYGSFSSVKSVKPVPATPAITTAPAGYNSVKISWKKVSGASGYQVYRATSKTGTYSRVATVTNGSTVTYTNKSLTTGKTYYYKVRAYRTVNGTKVYGSFSSVKSVKPVPAKPSIAAVRASSSSIRISWKKVSGASGYQVYRATSKAGTYSRIATVIGGSTVAYTNRSLTRGKTYYYKVRAYRKVNGTNVYGSFSAVKSAKP
jgi:uncharacterized protein YjdB